MQYAKNAELVRKPIESQNKNYAMNRSPKEACTANCSFPDRSSAKCLLFRSKVLISEAVQNAANWSHMNNKIMVAGRFAIILQFGGSRVFIRLLRAYFVKGGYERNLAEQKFIRVPSSAIIRKYRALAFSDQERDGFFAFVGVDSTVVQRTLATW